MHLVLRLALMIAAPGDAEAGEIRLPRVMLPAIRGGKDGWLTLSKVRVSDREILASASVNPLNNPKVRVDRITGSITISGKAGNYVGQCRKYDPNSAERAF